MPESIWVIATEHPVPKGPGAAARRYISPDVPAQVPASSYILNRLRTGELKKLDPDEGQKRYNAARAKTKKEAQAKAQAEAEAQAKPAKKSKEVSGE